jgi:multidrug efflux pump subunit AcrB
VDFSILKRRDRTPTITVQSDHDESVQPPQVTAEVLKSIQPIIAKLPDRYRIEVGANAEESAKANAALAKVLPMTFVCTLIVIIRGLARIQFSRTSQFLLTVICAL